MHQARLYHRCHQGWVLGSLVQGSKFQRPIQLKNPTKRCVENYEDKICNNDKNRIYCNFTTFLDCRLAIGFNGFDLTLLKDIKSKVQSALNQSFWMTAWKRDLGSDSTDMAYCCCS